MNLPTFLELATICALLFGAVFLLIGILWTLPATAPAAAKVWPDLKSATITFGLTIGFLALGGWFLKGFLAAIFLRACFEAFIVAAPRLGSLGATMPKGLAIGLSLGAAALLGGAHLVPIEAAFLSIGALFAISFLLVIFAQGKGWIVWIELLLFPIFPALLFVLAAGLPNFAVLALAAYIIVETFDGYALLGGKIWGKTPAFPKLSPKKTIEGLAIGTAATAVSVGVAGYFLLDVPPVLLSAFTVVVVVLTVMGDLAASALKRRAGVKDFPTVLRPQGGALDVYDAWIAAVSGLGMLYVLNLIIGAP